MGEIIECAVVLILAALIVVVNLGKKEEVKVEVVRATVIGDPTPIGEKVDGEHVLVSIGKKNVLAILPVGKQVKHNDVVYVQKVMVKKAGTKPVDVYHILNHREKKAIEVRVRTNNGWEWIPAPAD